jgi:hypothetical protein
MLSAWILLFTLAACLICWANDLGCLKARLFAGHATWCSRMGCQRSCARGGAEEWMKDSFGTPRETAPTKPNLLDNEIEGPGGMKVGCMVGEGEGKEALAYSADWPQWLTRKGGRPWVLLFSLWPISGKRGRSQEQGTEESRDERTPAERGLWS